jgi:hypothetical protein
VGRWLAGWSDRLLLFLRTSAVFHAFFGPFEYLLYSNYLHRLDEGRYRNLIWEVPSSRGRSLWSLSPT